MCIRDSPKLQRRLDRNTRHPRSPNHGDRWIQTIEESATVVLRGLRRVSDTQKLKWRILIASGVSFWLACPKADDMPNPLLLPCLCVVTERVAHRKKHLQLAGHGSD